MTVHTDTTGHRDGIDPGRFYGVAAIVERWGVGRETVWHKIQAGELRARKIGKGWAVHGTALRDYEAGSDFAADGTGDVPPPRALRTA